MYNVENKVEARWGVKKTKKYNFVLVFSLSWKEGSICVEFFVLVWKYVLVTSGRVLRFALHVGYSRILVSRILENFRFLCFF